MRKQSSSERGQSLVEIALILPVILILFLGIAEVGFILYAHVQVANATREGARRGSLCRFNENCDNWPTAVIEAVKDEPAPGINRNKFSFDVQPASFSSSGPARGTPLTVTVTYSHTLPFVSNFVPMFPPEIPLQHRSVMYFDK